MGCGRFVYMAQIDKTVQIDTTVQLDNVARL